MVDPIFIEGDINIGDLELRPIITSDFLDLDLNMALIFSYKSLECALGFTFIIQKNTKMNIE